MPSCCRFRCGIAFFIAWQEWAEDRGSAGGKEKWQEKACFYLQCIMQSPPVPSHSVSPAPPLFPSPFFSPEKNLRTSLTCLTCHSVPLSHLSVSPSVLTFSHIKMEAVPKVESVEEGRHGGRH